QSFIESAAAAANIVPVEGFSQSDIRACIETLRQLGSLIIQIGIHGKALVLRAVGAKRVFARLRRGTKTLIDFHLPAVGWLRNPSCRSQPCVRELTGVVLAALPEGVAFNRRDLRRLNANLPG